MNSLEIADAKNIEKKKMTDIVEKCKKEVRTMNVDEQVEFDDSKQKIEDLNQQLEDLNAELRKYEDETNKVDVEKRNNNKKQINKRMKFNLLKVINDVINNRTIDEAAQSVINRGIEQMKRSGQSYSGQIILPLGEYRNAIAATVAGQGIENVQTDVYDILEPLRAQNILAKAGAKYLTNLVGDVSIPIMTAGNCSWEGENDSANDGAGTFSSVKLQAHRLSTYIDVSKQFLIQDSNDALSTIQNDIVAAVNSKLESTILSDFSGTTNQPKGIFAAVPPTGTTTTFTGIASLGNTIDDANVMGERVYILSNSAKAKFRTTSKGTGNVGFILENGEIDGEKTLSSSNVLAGGLIYGDFSNLAIAQFGGLEIIADQFTQAKNGMVRLVINAYFDAKVLRPAAFVTSKIA